MLLELCQHLLVKVVRTVSLYELPRTGHSLVDVEQVVETMTVQIENLTPSLFVEERLTILLEGDSRVDRAFKDIGLDFGLC